MDIIALDSSSARRPISTRSSSRTSRRSTSSSTSTCRARRPVALHRLRAREGPGGRGLRARPDPADVREARDARCRRRASPRRSRTPATRSPGRSTTPSAIADRRSTYAPFRRSYQHGQQLLPRRCEALTPADIQAAARKYFTDAGLSSRRCRRTRCRPASSKRRRSSVRSRGARRRRCRQRRHRPSVPTARRCRRVVLQKSVLPQLDVKLLFTAGSAHDPAGKEGLAALAAAMIADAGSKQMRIDEINKALYPMAGTFIGHVDKEMTTFTGVDPPGQLADSSSTSSCRSCSTPASARRTSSV